jgi:hypothetical protein
MAATPTVRPTNFLVMDMTVPPSDELGFLTDKTRNALLRPGVRPTAAASRRASLNVR